MYSGWAELEGAVGRLVAGRRVAMEYSPGDAVPYVDRVPAGVVDMVRALGATVATSAELVTRLYAVWTPDQLAAHRRAAEEVAGVARAAVTESARRVAAGETVHEHEVAAEVRGQGVATVRVARPLEDGDRRRLAGALSRTYGHEVHLNVIVDPEVIGQLLARARRDDPLGRLTPRETEVLRQMAAGRSNAGIATELFVTEKAVARSIALIFQTLGLPPDPDDHRRVIAVMRYLQG